MKLASIVVLYHRLQGLLESSQRRPVARRLFTSVRLNVLKEPTHVRELGFARWTCERKATAIASVVFGLIAVECQLLDFIVIDLALACAGLEMEQHARCGSKAGVAAVTFHASWVMDLRMLSLRQYPNVYLEAPNSPASNCC